MEPRYIFHSAPEVGTVEVGISKATIKAMYRAYLAGLDDGLNVGEENFERFLGIELLRQQEVKL